ncbi:ketohexokinase-like isoform X2 [Belonocnema kinseyi]|uniref:ketohexokinase-like isoform X2 n=1 Tax=Belonocnema kinseyi TaxID=2817044 RepID=UPI00143CC7E4|nr:ketohexokinase-like isoform X2 [Belonocnema kinseyi]
MPTDSSTERSECSSEQEPSLESSDSSESSETSETSEPLSLLQPELKKKILCVGLCRTDIIQICREFPDEYSELEWQRGGNASNTCTVLAQFDVQVEFLGTLSGEEPRLHNLIGDMEEHHIEHSHCRTIPNTKSPISSILVNKSNHSRTVWNYNPNLPELTINEFNRLNLNDYSWIHFEGRNVNNVVQMMKAIHDHNTAMRRDEDRVVNNPIVVSLEVYKEISGICQLLPFADVVFIGEKFMDSEESRNMTKTLDYINKVDVKPGAILICAFDERGALGRAPNGEYLQCPAQPPRPIVDIFGVSDTFNAAMIYFLYQENISYRDMWDDPEDEEQINVDKQCPLEFIDPGILYQALVFACRLSGAKMGFKGFRQLRDLYEGFAVHREIRL